MSNAENGKLFDWKKSARYQWKQGFPLVHVDRTSRPAPAAAAEPPLPASVVMLKSQPASQEP